MRNFSKFEQRVILELSEIDLLNSNILTFIAQSFLKDRGIQILEKEKTIKLMFKKTDENAISEFFELIALIKYLEINHLIFKHSNPSIKFKGSFVSKNIDQKEMDDNMDKYHIFEIPTNIYDVIQDFKTSFIICGTELKELVKNNFKSKEDINHQREMKIAKLSLGIAFIALLFSFCSPYFFDTTIDKRQFKQIINQITNTNSVKLGKVETGKPKKIEVKK